MKCHAQALFLLAAVLASAASPLSSGCTFDDASEKSGEEEKSASPGLGPGDTISIKDEHVEPEYEQPEDDEGTGTCGVRSRSVGCDICGREKCCQEQTDCLDDSACIEWLNCAAECRSVECAVDCMTDSAPARALSTCWSLRCTPC